MGWNANPETNLTVYILRYGRPSGSSTAVEIPVTETNVTVSNLTAQATYTFTLTAKNALGLESRPSDLVSTNLPGTNHAPVATAMAIETVEDQSVPVTLAGTDPDADQLSFQVASSPAHGSLTGIAPNLTYTPVANYSGTDSFTFVASDGVSNSAVATISLQVFAVNDTPTLNSINNVNVNEDGPLQTVNLSGIGAGGGESQTLVVTASSGNTNIIPHPSVSYTSPNATGSLSFTPRANANGAVTITVTVDDGGASNNTVSRFFTVTVASVNDRPTLNSLTNRVLLEDAGSQLVALSGISSGATNENQPLTITAVSSNPQVIPTPVISYASPNPSGTLTFTPATNAAGSAVISVIVDDGQAQNHSVTQSFTVTITAVNDTPTLTAIVDQTILQNESTDPIPFTVDDEETPAGSLTVAATSSNPTLLPSSGIVLGGVGSSRNVRLTPATNQTGSAIVRVSVSDGNSSRTNAFTLTVNHGNYAPTLDSIAERVLSEDATGVTVPLTGIGSGATNESQTLELTAHSSNPELLPDPLVIYISPATTGSLELHLNANASGSSLISVTVDDGGTENSRLTRQFLVTVNAENDAPTITAIAEQVTEPGVATRALTFSINDVETPATTLQLTSSSTNTALLPPGNIVLAGSGTQRTVKLTPASGQLGQSLVALMVSDGTLVSTSAFLLTVVSSNHPPSISAIADQSTPAYTELAGIAFTVADAESPASALGVTASSSQQALLPNANILIQGNGTNRTLTLRPQPGKQGVAIITLTVSDGQRSAQSSFQLTVQAGAAPQSVLTVQTQGAGSITPNLNGQSLLIGTTYSLTAVPSAGNIFTGWTGGVTSSSPSLKFVMSSNLTLQAGFMTNPFTPLAGQYNGLYYEETGAAPGRAGFLTLKTTGQGTYSGKLYVGAKPLGLSGRLDFAGRGTNHITRKGTNAVTLEFELHNGNAGTVEGRVTDGEWEAVLLGDRAAYAKTNPAPFAGNYTMILPGTPNPVEGPEGHGFGTVKIDVAGVASFAGTLSDGSKVSQKVALSRAGQWPLYAGLYAGSGLLLSWQTVTNRVSDDITGVLSWIRPAQPASKFWPQGFSYETITIGSSYVRPIGTNRVLELTQGALVCQGGNLPASLTNLFALDAGGKATPLDASGMTMTISASSGLFAGKVIGAEGKTASFRGAVLQKQAGGAGFLLGTNRSAQVFFGW